MRSRSIPLALSVACIVVLGLGACTSNPSAKAVTRDMIESLDEDGPSGIDPAEKECMLEIVEAMPNGDLEAIGVANETFVSGDEAAMENVTPEMQAFIDDLRTCLNNG